MVHSNSIYVHVHVYTCTVCIYRHGNGNVWHSFSFLPGIVSDDGLIQCPLQPNEPVAHIWTVEKTFHENMMYTHTYVIKETLIHSPIYVHTHQCYAHPPPLRHTHACTHIIHIYTCGHTHTHLQVLTSILTNSSARSFVCHPLSYSNRRVYSIAVPFSSSLSKYTARNKV